MPERIVLVHVECAGDSNRAARCGRRVKALTVKEQMVLVVEQVRGVALLLQRLAGALLAAVARDEAATVVEDVHREQTVVRAASAVDVHVLDSQVVDFLTGEDRGHPILTRTVTREQCGAVSAHVARDIRTDHVAAGQKFEGAQRRVTHKGAALDHDVLADLVVVTQLDDFEECVLNDGVGEACGDIADRSAFLLRLLDARVHKDRAAAAEVHRVLAFECGLREFLDRHAHGICEVRDKGTAAGGAGLVQRDVLNDAVVDLQALHVLATDIEDKVDIRDKSLSATQVRHGLDLTIVGLQGLDQDALAVSGGGHVTNCAVFRQMVVDIVHDCAGGTQDIAVVVAVPGVEQLAVFTDDSGLHGCGAGIDTDKDTAMVVLKLALRHDLLVVAGLELLIILLGLEERIQTGNLGALDVPQALELVDQLLEGDALVGLTGKRCAAGDKEVGVLRDNPVFLIELKRHIEALSELREIL